MIELNFGKSKWKNRWIYTRREGIRDNIIQIPEKGELPLFGQFVREKYLSPGLVLHWMDCYHSSYNYGLMFREYAELAEIKPYKDNIKGYPSVSVSRSRPNCTETDINLHMLWISERDEWIVIVHRKWEESPFRDDERYEHYFGPFTPDDMCADKIAEAYKTHRKLFYDARISSPPSQLERIARENQNG